MTRVYLRIQRIRETVQDNGTVLALGFLFKTGDSVVDATEGCFGYQRLIARHTALSLFPRRPGINFAAFLKRHVTTMPPPLYVKPANTKHTYEHGPNCAFSRRTVLRTLKSYQKKKNGEKHSAFKTETCRAKPLLEGSAMVGGACQLNNETAARSETFHH